MRETESGRHTLVHEAMATAFKVTVVHDDAAYARQAAGAVLAELDRIDGRLSRFVDSSDVSRINRLRSGQSTRVHLDTFDCLRIALEVQEATGGAFDVAYASRTPASRGPRFTLDGDGPAVRVLAEGVRLDLGGIGKGFALDRMAALLADWEVPAALLAASTSTLLGMGDPPGEEGWPVSFGPEHDLHKARLKGRAFSASGSGVRGEHVVDPRTGRPAMQRLRAWSGAPAAAEADALSTAFLVLSDAEIRDFCRRRPDVSACLLDSPSAPVVTIAVGNGAP